MITHPISREKIHSSSLKSVVYEDFRGWAVLRGVDTMHGGKPALRHPTLPHRPLPRQAAIPPQVSVGGHKARFTMRNARWAEVRDCGISCGITGNRPFRGCLPRSRQAPPSPMDTRLEAASPKSCQSCRKPCFSCGRLFLPGSGREGGNGRGIREVAARQANIMDVSLSGCGIHEEARPGSERLVEALRRQFPGEGRRPRTYRRSSWNSSRPLPVGVPGTCGETPAPAGGPFRIHAHCGAGTAEKHPDSRHLAVDARLRSGVALRSACPVNPAGRRHAARKMSKAKGLPFLPPAA